jgi:hypothetical protein
MFKLVSPEPSPKKAEADIVPDDVIFVLTDNPLSGEIEALTDPDVI